MDRFLDKLKDFISIPSISGIEPNKKGLEQAADFLCRGLESMNFQNIQKLPTDAADMVYAEINSDRPGPCLLIYGHYDVVASGEGWDRDPFTPILIEGRLIGRGASDMKGQIIGILSALKELIVDSELHIPVKILFEGAEEQSSRILEKAVGKYRNLLHADLLLNPDGGINSIESPAVIEGFRGNCGGILTVYGSKHEVHSGEYGGAVLNPVFELCRFIAALKDRANTILVPGFYEMVESYNSPLEKSFPAELLTISEPGFSPTESCTLRPSLDIVHVDAGREAMIIPSSARARISIRSVPRQTSEELEQKISTFARDFFQDKFNWSLDQWRGYDPFSANTKVSGFSAMQNAYQKVFGKEAEFIRSGGGLPVAAIFKKELHIDSILTGFSLPEDRIHGPGESVSISILRKSIEWYKEFIRELSPPKPTK
jgi:acetylornithine deacetylase/succinyl-diaminopimelate desuccinylase-like protein